MAKSNLVLLQEALAKGDLEKAQELTAKLVKAGKIKTTKVINLEKAPKTPAKASSKKVATKLASKPKRATKGKPGIRNDIGVHELEESSYLAPSRLTSDDFGGRKFIGADGQEHTYAKRVSLEGIKFVNKFDPSQYTRLPAKHEKVDKKLKNLKISPKPGQRGAQRDVAKKVDARCVICHNVVKVYPWEAETVDGESSFRCSKKSCIKAR